MGTYDQVHTDILVMQKKIFHRIIDGVGSEEEFRIIQENYLKNKMSFMFDGNAPGENRESPEEGMTEASASDFSEASKLLGIRDSRILENLLTDHDFTDFLKKAFVKLMIHEGKIDRTELEQLIQNIDRVKQVMDSLKDLVPERLKKELIKTLAVYLCVMDEEIKNGTSLQQLNTKELLKKAA